MWMRAGELVSSRWCLLLVALLWGGSMSAWTQSAAEAAVSGIVVDGHVSILVDAQQPGPVKLAADDLASDMEKVFGAKPKVVSRVEDASGVTIVVGDVGEGAPAKHDAAPEAFSITTGTSTRSDGRTVKIVRLAGEDMRGTIFAIYQFSQEFLGVDPMYYWTDHVPVRRASLRLSAGLAKSYVAPVFRYRGFFINDEDLLTGWASGEAKDHTGISLAVWNKICETVLRLKGNMLVAGTWPFPDEPQDKVVADRGLLLNQHHAEPLGVNFSRWPANVPYNFTAHPEYIENAWKNSVASYPQDQEILWTIGLRGLSDQPYSALDPPVANDDKAQARVMSKAIAEQMKIVRAKYPKAVFITNLWMEGAKLMRSGDLVIPPEVITVWPDTGYGDMQDHGQVKAGQGAYIHVAMYNGKANQLSELTPVSTIFDSLGRFQAAGATSFLLVNTSDIRPVPMGASAVLDFGWKGSAIGDADAYYRDWSKDEFGAKAAGAVAAMYKAYFAAPAKRPGDEALPYGDQYYYTAASDLIFGTSVQWPVYTLPGQTPPWAKPGIHPYDPAWAPKQAEVEIRACSDAEPRWDAVWEQALAAEPLVDASRREFYQEAVLTMVAINRDSNRMLLAIAQAVRDLREGKRDAASADVARASQALTELKAAEAKAEYGKWKNWYRGDTLVGVDRTRKLVEGFAEYVKDPHAPVALPFRQSNWEGYYNIQHYQGQQVVDTK